MADAHEEIRRGQGGAEGTGSAEADPVSRGDVGAQPTRGRDRAEAAAREGESAAAHDAEIKEKEPAMTGISMDFIAGFLVLPVSLIILVVCIWLLELVLGWRAWRRSERRGQRALDLSVRIYFDAVVEELRLPQLLDWLARMLRRRNR